MNHEAFTLPRTRHVHHRRMRVAVLAVAAGCAYHPGSFQDKFIEFHGTQLTLGCVDLAVARAPRDLGHGPIVEYTFGNRCDHRAGIDLATVRATARTPDGAELALAPFDPHHELRPLPLIARRIGQEMIEYRGAPPDSAVCVDVGGIDQTVARTEKWICL